ncbi:MAG: hypothetical protein EA382_03975 [Spirochaetaceae bacterium]|nr:MAG: hypothetical protein EA382_03975 [Spirochaetaceae bacterium]
MNEPEDRPISEYLEDIRQIRETMLLAENRLHVPAWFFFTVAATIGAGTIAHAVASLVFDVDVRTISLAIWLPLGAIGGIAEIIAWIAKGRREGLPWLSRTFGRFIVTVAGTMTAVVVLAAMGLPAGMSPSGLILVVGAATFLVYSPYCPVASVWIGWALLAPGVAILIAVVSGPALEVAAAAAVVIGFVVVGVAERRARSDG